MFLALTWFFSGNRGLLPVLKARAQSEASESGNLIVYNGAMVDIGSMMQKLEKSEKAREEIEQKLIVQDVKMGKIRMIYCMLSVIPYVSWPASYTLCQ